MAISQSNNILIRPTTQRVRIGFIIPDSNPTLLHSDNSLEYQFDSVHQGIGYVAAYAKENCLIDEIQVFRTYGKSEKDLIDFLEQGWFIIGIPLSVLAIDEAASIAEMTKSICHAKVVVGGAEVTTNGEDALRKNAYFDFAVFGEGEITFSELVNTLTNKGDFSKIKGLIYRNAEGQICKNKPRGFEKNLEVFPYLDRTLFKYEYNYHSIIGTRGCPFHCTFCNSSACWGHTYRLRDPSSIHKEIEYILRLYGNEKIISFQDDSFNINKSWVLDVCRRLKTLNISWWIRGLRANLVTEDIADALVDSHCVGVACGVESANNKCLKDIRKGTTIEAIMKGVENLQSRGIPVLGQFIIGNHSDTLETVKESIECARQFSEATFGIAFPIIKTFLYDYVKSNNLFLPEPVPIKFKNRTISKIIFDTPQFSVKKRLEAANLAIKEKFFHNINYDED